MDSNKNAQPTAVQRVKNIAMFQTLCVMLTMCSILIATAIITRLQHHSDDLLPISTKQVLQSEASIAAVKGLKVLQKERQTPGSDRINRMMQVHESVTTLNAIRKITKDDQFAQLADSKGAKIDLRRVRTDLENVLRQWSATST